MLRSPLRFAVLACLVVALAVLLCQPLLAAAGEAAWPVSGSEVLLSHGSAYQLGDQSRTHSGADIVASDGESAVAALSGQVTFVGRVPGAGGEQVLAVTMLCGDVKLTYLPLASASVKAGDEAAAGDELGSVAAAGDPSSADTHLHVSARRGSLYVDPVPLMRVVPASAEEPKTSESPAPTHVESPDAPPVQAPSAAGGTAVSGAARSAPAPETAPAPLAAAVAQAPATAAPARPPAGAGATAGATAANPAPAAPAPAVAAAARPAALAGAGGAATAVAERASSGMALFGIGGSPAVGLRLPGIAEVALGLAASLALRFGLGRSQARRTVGNAALAPVRERG